MIKLKEIVAGEMPERNKINKRNFFRFMLMFHKDDLRKIKRWEVKEDGNDVIIYIYFSLIGQEALETMIKFVDSKSGIIRIYPGEHSCCVEIKIRNPKI